MLVALSVTGLGIMIPLIAQASGGDNIANYISGGGSAAAVGGLVYMARKILSGDLVSRPTVVVEKELARLIQDSHDRETGLQNVMADANKREDAHIRFSERALAVLGRVER